MSPSKPSGHASPHRGAREGGSLDGGRGGCPVVRERDSYPDPPLSVRRPFLQLWAELAAALSAVSADARSKSAAPRPRQEPPRGAGLGSGGGAGLGSPRQPVQRLSGFGGRPPSFRARSVWGPPDRGPAPWEPLSGVGAGAATTGGVVGSGAGAGVSAAELRCRAFAARGCRGGAAREICRPRRSCCPD